MRGEKDEVAKVSITQHWTKVHLRSDPNTGGAMLSQWALEREREPQGNGKD